VSARTHEPTDVTETPGEPQSFRFASFAAVPAIRHGITGRAAWLWREGDISYATGGDPAAVFANRERWADNIGVDAAAIVAVRQVHGNTVDIVTADARGRGARTLDVSIVPAADALLTDAPDTPLLLAFADCTPLLFHDPQRGVVGLAHAGWRGTVADIAGETVRALARHYDSDPARIIVGIGPAIGACCYQVDTPVIAAWAALGVDDPAVAREVEPHEGRRQWRFDLARANRRLLERAGIAPDHIEDAALCTACHVADYPSHRAEAGRAGRFAAIIALHGGDERTEG
jgi:YfiH family protein